MKTDAEYFAQAVEKSWVMELPEDRRAEGIRMLRRDLEMEAAKLRLVDALTETWQSISETWLFRQIARFSEFLTKYFSR